MNEILVEEENTVYELDPECLKRKEQQKKEKKKHIYEAQKISKDQRNFVWLFCILFLLYN